MDNSIYVALSKQAGAERQMALIANNIANANTPGFKSEASVFAQHLQKDGTGKTAYVNDIGTIRDNSQGPLQTTGNPLDLAIEGDGFFAVKTPDGERYTRAGNFSINSQGELTNAEGYQVLDQAGQSITFQPEDRKIKVFADGRMEVDGDERATIGVYGFAKNSRPEKLSGSLYSSKDTATVVDEPKVAQGMLENSNVQPIIEMSKMISVQRDYERTAKFINEIYDMQGTAVQTFAKQ